MYFVFKSDAFEIMLVTPGINDKRKFIIKSTGNKAVIKGGFPEKADLLSKKTFQLDI